MQTVLLGTKTHFPSARQALVPRPRLNATLSQVLSRRLTLVSAPAGSGKTTLVGNWLQEAGLPSAWLSLDRGDNDPVRFMAYLVSALQEAVPALAASATVLGEGSEATPPSVVLNLVINGLASHRGPVVLVLDDFHVIQAPPVLELVAFLLERLPPQAHVILLSRADPPLPLSRLRLEGQLLELRTEHLWFTVEESAAFFNEVSVLSLPADDVAAIHALTEGWVAGLQLAAVALQGRLAASGGQDAHAFIAAFTGSHHYITDYLLEEVLASQPEAVRAFLLQTSILDRLCGPLCEAILAGEGGDRIDGQAVLEQLTRKNLFLVPLDDERRWYRYHHLFADVLHQHLERIFPGRLAGLHRKASLWYEQQGLVPEAIRHASQAGEHARAALMVEQYGCLLLLRGEVVTLLDLIEAVEPPAQARPWLAIQKAWALSLSGQFLSAEEMLQRAEGLANSLTSVDESSQIRGAALAARALAANAHGDTPLAAEYAERAIALLFGSAPMSCVLRSVATTILGDSSWLNGNLERAREAYSAALAVAQAAGDVNATIIANTNLAGVQAERGELHQAASTYGEALRLAAGSDGRATPLAAEIYAGLSRMAYERNHLDEAQQRAGECLTLARQWGKAECQAIGQVIVARVEHARRRPQVAREAMRAAEEIAGGHRISSKGSTWVVSALAGLWVSQGEGERAEALLRRLGITLDVAARGGKISYLRTPGYAALTRVLVARGEHDAALALAATLGQEAEATGAVGRQIESLVLQALAHQGRHDLASALPLLGKALLLAQPAGYVRLFLDEGEAMARLLYQAKSHQVVAGFAGELLAIFASASGVQRPPTQLLIEPLSARELEVLRLVQCGYSNQQIADRLVISVKTAKRHISNIYDKLGAKSRTHALSLAAELGLFD